MKMSLNEIGGLAKKAARGAGLPWGLSEEAADATRWLSAHGFDGPATLASELRHNDRVAYSELAPRLDAGPWRAADRAMCPLIAGATLADHAYLLAEGNDIVLGRVSYPALLVPFASRAAHALGVTLQMSWPACQLYFSPEGGMFQDEGANPGTEEADGVTCTRIEALPPGIASCRPVADPDVATPTLTFLNALAARTCVPTSDTSRLRGAGAGLSDND